MLTKVTGSVIADYTVTTEHLASGSVVTVNLLDACVTTSKLAPDAITTVTIADGAVTERALGSGCITADKVNHELFEHSYPLLVASGEVLSTNTIVCLISGELESLQGRYTSIIGIATDTVVGPTTCEIVDLAKSRYVTGFSGLISDTYYYCNASGELTTTPGDYLVGRTTTAQVIAVIGKVI